MTLIYDQIRQLHQEVAPLIEFQKFIHISNIEERKFLLEFSEYSLLLCFQEPFLRFHLSTMKRQNQISLLSQSINQILKDSVLEGFHILNVDRILQFKFKTGKDYYFLIAEFFPKKPNFYLLNSDFKILQSLNPARNETYHLPEKKQISSEKSEPINSFIVDKLFREKEYAFAFEKKKLEIKAKLQSGIKRLNRQKKDGENNLKACLQWEQKQHEASLLQANFPLLKKGMNEITLLDWDLDNAEVTIALDPTLSPKDEIKKRFKIAKKLKVGIEHQQKQLMEIDKHLKLKEKELETIEPITTLKELSFLFPVKEKKSKTEEITLPYREYQSKTGFKILVGKNSSSNDALTFKYAKGHDLWLHVKDFPGSHVVIRTSKGKPVDQETIDDAVQIAIFYSKAKKMNSAEVCLTEKKFVSRFGKNKDGKVQISKQKVIHAKANPDRFKALQGNG